jgi:hypothetical protein
MRRYDYVFSYWLFLWYILYMLKLVPFNPFWFLVVATVANGLDLICGHIGDVPLFILINIVIKLIPLYTLWGSKLRRVDVYAGLVYFVAYLAWMKLNKEPIIVVRTPLTDLLKEKFYKVS